MVRKLTRLKREIRAQEAALDERRRRVAARYDDVRTHYRSRLSSPSALMSSFATGIVIGTLVQRPRRGKQAAHGATRDRMGAWLSAVVGPALLHVLRTRAAGLFDTRKP
ncbi:MAG: hypothetical protein ACREVE_08385 [Gammaproteobacteria bacterium]